MQSLKKKKKGLIADLIAEKLPEKGQKIDSEMKKTQLGKTTCCLKLNCDIKRLKSGVASVRSECRPWLQNSELALKFG